MTRLDGLGVLEQHTAEAVFSTIWQPNTFLLHDGKYLHRGEAYLVLVGTQPLHGALPRLTNEASLRGRVSLEAGSPMEKIPGVCGSGRVKGLSKKILADWEPNFLGGLS